MTSPHHRSKRVSSTFFQTASWSRLLLALAVMHLHQAAAETDMDICLKVRSGDYRIRALGLVGNRFYLLTKNGYFVQMPSAALSVDSSPNVRLTIHTQNVVWEMAASRFPNLAPFDHETSEERFYLYSDGGGIHYLGKWICGKRDHGCGSWTFITYALNSPDAMFTLDETVFLGDTLIVLIGVKRWKHFRRLDMTQFRKDRQKYNLGAISSFNMATNLDALDYKSWFSGQILGGFHVCVGHGAVLTVMGDSKNVTLVYYEKGCIRKLADVTRTKTLALEDMIDCRQPQKIKEPEPEPKPSPSETPPPPTPKPDVVPGPTTPPKPVYFQSVADADDKEEKEDIFCYDDKSCPYLVARAKSMQTTKATVIHHGANTAVKLLWVKAAIALITLFSLVFFHQNARIQREREKRKQRRRRR